MSHVRSQRSPHSCLVSAVLVVPCHRVSSILSSRMLVIWLVEGQLSLASVGDVKEGAGEGEGMKREYHI